MHQDEYLIVIFENQIKQLKALGLPPRTVEVLSGEDYAPLGICPVVSMTLQEV